MNKSEIIIESKFNGPQDAGKEVMSDYLKRSTPVIGNRFNNETEPVNGRLCNKN